MGYGLWVTGYRLWVMGYGLRAMGYRLWVMCYGLRVIGYGLRVNGYWLQITCCGLRVTTIMVQLVIEEKWLTTATKHFSLCFKSQSNFFDFKISFPVTVLLHLQTEFSF